MANNLKFACVLGLALVLAACGGSPAPSTAVDERPTPTPLPAPPAWREAAAPITLENIESITRLGRLEIPGTPDTIYSYALSPDNTRLIGLSETFIIGWDLITGRILFSFTRTTERRLFYSPDKAEFYGISEIGEIHIFDSETGAEKERLNAQPNYNSVVAYHPDLGLLALGNSAGDIKIWDMFERVSKATLVGGSIETATLVFSSDGSRLAVTYRDGTILIWDWLNRTVTAEVDIPPAERRLIFYQLAFSPDGQHLLGAADVVGAVWKVDDGSLLGTLPIETGGSEHVFKVMPTGSYLLTSGQPEDASLWNYAALQRAGTFDGVGGGFPVDAAFSPDGNFMITSQFGGNIVLWNLANLSGGTVARSRQQFDNTNILNVEWTTDGFLILMIDSRGPIDIWGIPPG